MPRGERQLLFLFLQLGFVSGFLYRCDELLRIDFPFLDFDHCFVGMGYLGADDTRNLFKCRPHFLGTVDGSGHARNNKVHSLLCLGFGCLRIAG